jgi:periplasmic divalent cation tolerance protein
MENCKETDILAVTTTVASRADGERLARELVQHRLAACVQLEEGLTSFYRWQGELCADAEVRLVIKTLPEARDALLAFIGEHHPYEVPQFLAVRMSASEAYAAWACEAVPLTAAGRAQTPGR